MPKDLSFVDKILSKSALRQETARLFDQAGFKVTYAADGGLGSRSRPCAIYVRPNRSVQHLFNLKREILVWVVDFPEFEARNVTEAYAHVAGSKGRLDDQFMIIVTGDPLTELAVTETTERLVEKMYSHVVGLSSADISSLHRASAGALVRELQARFYGRDLYDIGTAIVAPVNYFGRKALRNELVAEIREGRNLGVFGLRKMGKTSLLYRLVEALKSDSRAAFAHVDVQRVEAVDPSPEYLMWTLGDRLLESTPRLRKLDGMRLFGRYGLFSDIPNRDAVPEQFVHDLKLVFSESKYRVTFLLDEVELLSPDRASASWSPGDFVRFWRVVRGVSQESPARLSVYVTGTNPSCIEANRFGDQDNPIYNFFQTKFLAPLSDSEGGGECGELLRTIGERMGLIWTDGAVGRLERLVGGHPYLLRAFASVVHLYLSPRPESVSVDEGVIDVLVQDFLRAHDADFSQLVDVLKEQYEDEHVILRTLAEGRVGEFRELAHMFPSETSHLKGYGLIDTNLRGAGLRIELLQSWFQKRSMAATPANTSPVATGDRFGSYEILESIGKRGGFGQVYKAVKLGDLDRDAVALKVLHKGSISSLQREVDVLKDVDHPNIVKFFEHGQFDDGQLYLAMEFVPGHTLEQYCDRASRLSPEGVVKVADRLLLALASLHPDPERIEAARKNVNELTVEEYIELGRARHGYVHRDIKPQNVIDSPARGPVLIDFGISVRVAQGVDTMKATPGYLPPDWTPDRWTPDVDLYQLGLTLLQVGTGIPFEGNGRGGDNRGDLITAASELPTPLARFLTQATASNRADRFFSANQARQALLAGGV